MTPDERSILDLPRSNLPPITSTNAARASKSRVVLPLLLKRKQAARLCGFSIATWDRMSAAGLNPFGLRIGGARMYRRDELRAWVAQNCPPRAEWTAIWEMICDHRRDDKRRSKA